jgi:hypothetical protein
MAEDTEITQIILNEIDRQWSWAKQSADQRATFSNFILFLTLATQVFVVEKGFSRYVIALAVCIAALGIFGLVAVAKYFERFRIHAARVGRLRERLDRLHPGLKLDDTEMIADIKHNGRHPVTCHIRLHLLWQILMLGIALMGAFDVYMICKFGN